MNKEFLLKYLNTDSPSTFEKEAQQVWLNEVSHLADEIIKDNYGNVVLKINGTNSDYKVVIDAHADEIGWVVKSISDDGYISVQRNGGTDNDITPGTNVRILTSTNKIKGFFGWLPIHLKKSENPDKPTNENIFIEVGASSKEEVEKLGIEIGNFIVVDREAEFLNDKYILGKSLDDKIGGFIHAEVLSKLKSNNIKLPYDLYIVNSVQEEVGLRGAKMIAETIKPDVAICFDVTFDTNTPLIDKSKHGNYKMGEGLVFRQGADVHNNLLKLMKDIAKLNNMDYKVQVGGSGGTNTYSYYLSNGGVVTSTLSIPLRYMHTQNEMVMLEDIEKSVDFYIELLKNIEYKHDFKYF